MLENFNKRKVIRQFLKAYSEELWPKIIPDVFEIGILVLQTSYNKISFGAEELEEIISKFFFI